MLPLPWEEGQVHLFELGGHRFLFDGSSSSLFALSPVAHSLLHWGAEYNLEESLFRTTTEYGAAAAAALAELEEFHQQSTLLGPDPVVDCQTTTFPYLKALCLNLAHDCNLRCRYCFATTGSFAGPRGLMPLAVAQQAIELLLRHAGPLRRLEVDFFGGEPLLNFAVLQATVEYGKRRADEMGKESRFTLTTNALLLKEEITEFCNQEEMRVVLSIDGRPADHDRMRTFANGQGSYALVLARIQQFLGSRNAQRYYLRGTYTSDTMDFRANTLHLHDLGYQEISMEPVVALSEDPYALRQEHIPALLGEYEALVLEIARREEEGHPLHFFHFEVDTAGLSCLSKKLAGCGAGAEYLAVTPSGDLYPCHQFVGRQEFLLGNVEQGITNERVAEEFRHLSYREKPACRRCWARNLCSGGCHANAHLLTGDIRQPDLLGCQLVRKRMECALYLKWRRKERIPV
ncbi:MAG: thioether cross-link-forming SCIFF peptide maturase [Coprothermobacterota bacterium]|nr:thioether cross-link-forming SCIFF peptide maturase [Coprothermobacterota bacterium]